MDVNERISIHNRFDIEVIDARTGELRQKAVGYNKILNQLYSRMLGVAHDGGNYSCYTAYGSGSGTPAATDTSLFHHEGAKANSVFASAQDLKNCVTSMTKWMQLTEQEAVGVEITEVGLAYGTNSSYLTTHAMLEDMNGNPISIEKTDADIINIYSTIYVHWNSNAKFTPLLLRQLSSGGRSYWTFRQWIFGLNDTYYSDPAGACFCYQKYAISYNSNTGNTGKDGYNFDTRYGFASKTSTWTADVANKKMVAQAGRLAVAEGNVNGGIGCIFMAINSNPPSGMMFYIPVEDILSGTDITNEAVGTGDGTETEFALDYDFPTNAKIYVNGTQASNVTVEEIPNNTVPVLQYLKSITADSTPSRMIPDEFIVESSYPGRLWVGEIVYNRAWEIGIASITKTANVGVKVYGSNDLETWDLLADDADSNVTLTGNAQHYKYFKQEGGSAGNNYYRATLVANTYNGKAVKFNSAPANGAVITADYHTPYIAKDADHVFDFKITWQFGEYTE